MEKLSTQFLSCSLCLKSSSSSSSSSSSAAAPKNGYGHRLFRYCYYRSLSRATDAEETSAETRQNSRQLLTLLLLPDSSLPSRSQGIAIAQCFLGCNPHSTILCQNRSLVIEFHWRILCQNVILQWTNLYQNRSL